MRWYSILAIYMLFWTISAFVMLPLGIKSNEELGLEKVAGQADGTPGNFRPRLFFIRTTLFSAALFGLFYANFIYGWVSQDDLLIFGPPV